MLGLSPIAIYLFLTATTSLSWFVLGGVILKGLLDNVLGDYCYARAVVLTSATVASVGLGLQVPMAFLGDILFMGRSADQVVTFASIGCAAAVVAGFILVNLGQQEEQHSHECSKCSEQEEEEKIAIIPFEESYFQHSQQQQHDHNTHNFQKHISIEI